MIRGTVRDFLTGEPIAEADALVVPATDALDISQAQPLLERMADAQGQFEAVTEQALDEPFAVLGVLLHEDYAQSIVPLMEPDGDGNYPPSSSVKDWGALSNDDVASWNQMLASDPEVQDFLPLESAVAIYVVRAYGYPSAPIEGAVVESVNPDDSTAVVRYLDADGAGFNTDATSTNGVAVVFGGETGEFLDPQVDGMKLYDRRSARIALLDGLYMSFLEMEPAQ